MVRQPQSHRTREPFVRRLRGDRCGLATHYLRACGISFSQRLFEEGAVIHAHFTGGETKPQSSHATFPKIRGKTQALHPGPRGAVFAALLLCGTADPTSAATLRCHVESPESRRAGLRFGPLLSSALAFEARTRPSAASTVNVRRVHCRWPRRCCRARGSGPRAETRVTPSGSWPRGSPGHPGPAGAFPAGPRGGPSRGQQACGGRGRRGELVSPPCVLPGRTTRQRRREPTDRRAGAAPCASSWSAAGREGNAASVAQGRRAASEARGTKDRRGRAARTCGGRQPLGAPDEVWPLSVAPQPGLRGKRRPHRADGGSNPVLPPTHTVASGRSLPYPPSILTGHVAAAKHL